MKTYLILAEVTFDWSGGEYNNKSVENIYLGHGNFETKAEAEIEGQKLLKIYCEDDWDAKDYDSFITIKEL